MKAKTIKGWAVFDPNKRMVWYSIHSTKPASVFMVTGGMKKEQWKYMYQHGYRVRRITITVED